MLMLRRLTDSPLQHPSPHRCDLRPPDVHPGRFSRFLPHADKSKTINVTEKKG